MAERQPAVLTVMRVLVVEILAEVVKIVLVAVKSCEKLDQREYDVDVRKSWALVPYCHCYCELQWPVQWLVRRAGDCYCVNPTPLEVKVGSWSHRRHHIDRCQSQCARFAIGLEKSSLHSPLAFLVFLTLLMGLRCVKVTWLLADEVVS